MTNQQTDKIYLKLLLQSMKALEQGDFSVRLPTDLSGIAGEIADTFNTIVTQVANMSDELTQIKASDTPKKTVESPKSSSLLSGKKVLIVDDDVRTLFAYRSLFEAYKMDVIHAENGDTCLNLLYKNDDIDIILMDIMLPGLSGYDIMSKIRKDFNLYKIPIIVITAKSMEGERERCLKAGGSEYLSKPVNNEELISMLNRFLQV